MSTTAADDRRTRYNPVVATTDFAADFPVFDNDDLKVFVDGVERADFAVTATYVNGISTDAKAVFAVGVTGTVDVVGYRDPHRTNRFVDGAPLPTRDVNLALDTLEGEAQEARRDIERAVKVGYGVAEMAITPGTSGQVPVFDALGNLNPGSPSGTGNMLREVYDPRSKGGDSFPYDSISEASSASIPAGIKRIRTNFYAPLYAVPSTLDGGSHYRRVSFADLAGYQAQSYFRSIDRFMPDGSIDATNGGYWVIDSDVLTPEMFGVIADGAEHATNSDLFAQWLLTCDLMGKRGETLGDRTYIIGTQVSVDISKALDIVMAPGSIVKGALGDDAVLRIANATGTRPQFSLVGNCATIDNSQRTYAPGVASGTALELVRMGSIHAKGVTFQGGTTYGDSGIAAQECGRGVITGCTFYDQPDIGIYITGGASTGDTDDWGDIKIIGNHFERCEIAATARRQIGRVIMSNNTIKDCGAGLQTADATSGVTVIGFDRQVIITDNVGENLRGAFVDCRIAGKGSLICNNTVVDWGTTTATAAYGCIGGAGVLISGNSATIKNVVVSTHSGISLNDYTDAGGTTHQGTDCSIHGNQVIGAHTGVRDLSGGNNHYGPNRLLLCTIDYQVDETKVIHRNANGLGVGTSSPQAPLHLDGKMRISRVGVAAQYAEIEGSSGNLEIKSYSAPTAAKGVRVNVTTDASNTAPSAGNTDFVVETLSVEKFRAKDSGQVRLFPIAATPGRLENGDIWYNGTTHTLHVRVNGVTRSINVT